MDLCDKVPLVSVIITTYNYATFLPTAVESVRVQTYKNFEIIIIDDGSTDHTKSIIKDSWKVLYFYQENKGLAAARNAGIKKSNGDYLVFLDADDWLEKDALQKNFNVIKHKPGVAFVSGNYYLLHAESDRLEPICVSVEGDHYIRLLRSNYIGMHAVVMYQKWVFKEFKYDENLRACEDYDLYLSITKKYPVIHHPEFIATYYFHQSGLSHNYQLMIDSITAVMKTQAPYITSEAEAEAYKQGLQQWKDYYCLLQKTV